MPAGARPTVAVDGVSGEGYRLPSSPSGSSAAGFGAGCLAGLRSIGGGEIPQFTKLLSQSRNEAMARMVEEARSRGANAIISMRFDSGAIGQWSEICAYGTAVWVVPVSDAAKRQYDAMVQAGQMPHQQTYSTSVSEWSPPEAAPGQFPV